MHSLFAYRHLTDAWAGGVAEWCRAATRFALGGGQAWCVTAGPGQTRWLKGRLLAAGATVFGVRFLDSPADLRRALGERFGAEAPPFGRETLELLLRVQGARQAGPLLTALEELDAAGWLDVESSGEVEPLIPASLIAHGLLETVRRHPAFTPGLDRKLRTLAEGGKQTARLEAPPLSVLILGWDAGRLSRLDLMAAALRAATGYRAAFLPLPRAEAESLSQGWLETTAGALRVSDWETCAGEGGSEGATAPLAELVQRLESADLAAPRDEDAALGTRPDILVGREWGDAVTLARDWIARWLEEFKADTGARLAVIAPGRTPGAVALGRALGEAGIMFEDALGERPEAGLAWQIARAIVDYHLDETGTEPLLTLVGLLNDHPECLRHPAADFGLPLDPLALRRALAEAFAELQHTNARMLTGGGAFERHPLAGPVRRLVAHLDRWPPALGWGECRARWERCLRGFGLDAGAMLEPAWSRGAEVLPASESITERAFFEYLNALLAAGGGAARPMAEGGRKFARVVLTTLPEAAGQLWHSALFLEANEGVWPRPTAENPLLDDARRARLNARREELRAEGRPAPGHLLTTGDRVRLEACQFFEVLENCATDGRLAFSAARHLPGEPGREAHPNEWSLRCAIEAASAAERAADHWLERWRASARRCPSAPAALPRAERTHLEAVWMRRRDPEVGFDEYLFDFSELGAAPAAGELAFEPAWATGQLEAALRRPATFALEQIFGVTGWREAGGTAGGGAKTEAWAVGRLAHRWVRAALGGGREPQPLDVARVRHALAVGLGRARGEEEVSLGRALAAGSGREDGLPPWWRSVLAKTSWAARRCLESLAERVAAAPAESAWFCMGRTFSGEVLTPAGPLRLEGRADLLLLDRPELAGAACQFIDVKTGGHGAAPTLGQAADGRGGLGLAAGMLLAIAHGAEPAGTSAGTLHPEAANWAAFSAEGVAGLTADGAALSELARRQRGLLFGQGGAADVGERLPMATAPIPAGTLAAKARR